jgi:hypothetical protein
MPRADHSPTIRSHVVKLSARMRALELAVQASSETNPERRQELEEAALAAWQAGRVKSADDL